jgi:hypothetical protein
MSLHCESARFLVLPPCSLRQEALAGDKCPYPTGKHDADFQASIFVLFEFRDPGARQGNGILTAGIDGFGSTAPVDADQGVAAVVVAPTVFPVFAANRRSCRDAAPVFADEANTTIFVGIAHAALTNAGKRTNGIDARKCRAAILVTFASFALRLTGRNADVVDTVEPLAASIGTLDQRVTRLARFSADCNAGVAFGVTGEPIAALQDDRESANRVVGDNRTRVALGNAERLRDTDAVADTAAALRVECTVFAVGRAVGGQSAAVAKEERAETARETATDHLERAATRSTFRQRSCERVESLLIHAQTSPVVG